MTGAHTTTVPRGEHHGLGLSYIDHLVARENLRIYFFKNGNKNGRRSNMRAHIERALSTHFGRGTQCGAVGPQETSAHVRARYWSAGQTLRKKNETIRMYFFKDEKVSSH